MAVTGSGMQPGKKLVNLIADSTFSDISSWTAGDQGFTLSVGDGVATAEGPAGAAAFWLDASAQFDAIAGHKYYFSTESRLNGDPASIESYSILGLCTTEGPFTVRINYDNADFEWHRFSGVGEAPYSQKAYIFYQGSTGYFGEESEDPPGVCTIQGRKPLVIDLTYSFGAGYEPTAAEMDGLLQAYDAGQWFEDEAALQPIEYGVVKIIPVWDGMPRTGKAVKLKADKDIVKGILTGSGRRVKFIIENVNGSDVQIDDFEVKFRYMGG
jgi:hypothetical protein